MHLRSNFYRISVIIDVLILDDRFSPGRLRMGDFRMTFSSYHACNSVPTPLACLLSSGTTRQSFCVTKHYCSVCEASHSCSSRHVPVCVHLSISLGIYVCITHTQIQIHNLPWYPFNHFSRYSKILGRVSACCCSGSFDIRSYCNSFSLFLSLSLLFLKEKHLHVSKRYTIAKQSGIVA